MWNAILELQDGINKISASNPMHIWENSIDFAITV
jgi:hypothetical protein